MLIAEQLMLLSIDPQAGEFEASRTHADMNALAAAAIMLDLYEQHRLRYQGGHVVIETLLPTTHPQLAAAAQILAVPINGLTVAAAIDLLVTRLHPLSTHLLESLFRRDVLHRERTSWWPWSKLHFPLRSIQPRNEAAAKLQLAASAGSNTLRELGLLILTDLSGQLAASLSGNAHEAAAQKLLNLSAQIMSDNAELELLMEIRGYLTR
ncbi:MAG: GPP34 family phosphoprotein [Dokdonella sp.]